MGIHMQYRARTATVQLKPWQALIIGVIIAIGGIAILCISYAKINDYNQKNKIFMPASATVVDYKLNSDDLRAIVVTYEVAGETYKKTSDVYSSAPKSIGTRVELKYNPANPRDAIWVNDSTNIVLPIVGLVFTLLGILAAATSFKAWRTERLLEDPEDLGDFN